ncbi:hypothetical protein GCM10022222_09920 [Amycolatopsis ultiminotia]|uniref:DNA-directed DNA polymerase n=1 Tax=Amycolatopsis ultiminotia TaxID=543629 RepID=A0ABP6V9H6_9PSEU
MQVANVITYRAKGARRRQSARLLAGPAGRAAASRGAFRGRVIAPHTPVSEIVPVEWATAADRSVLQWDKDDCASMGLTKFDLLGLGMLSALHYMLDLVAEHHDVHIGLHDLDLADPAVYDMSCAADAVAAFQIESGAQLATCSGCGRGSSRTCRSRWR